MNISDTMLFRWVGYGIEKPKFKKHPANKRPPLTEIPDLTSEECDDYFSYLCDALNPGKGLKVGAVSDADRVGWLLPVVEPPPCLFFTEQAAGNSDQHWGLYGRLGFGFSKRFIFECGGRPVIYTRGLSKDPVVAAVESLRRLAREAKPERRSSFGAHVELLARFIKCTLPPRQPKSKPSPAGRVKTTKAETQQPDYPRHRPIRFLSEREWRLPVNPKSERFGEIKEEGEDAGWWFRPKLGLELQLIILPNNYFLHKAMNCENIRKRLSETSKQPVQLISAQALQKL